jgi:acyl-ACP thioesterase
MKPSQTDLILKVDYRIPTYYVSLNGQTKFYTLCSMLLESAASHASKFRFGYEDMKKDNTYWVLSRFHIRMHSYPVMDQPVRIETWPKGSSKLFYLRDYRMLSENGSLLAEATTAWLILDGNTGRPQKPEAGSRFHNYKVDGKHAIKEVPDKLPAIPDPDDISYHKAGYSDLDINRHVNAVKYIEWIQDTYPIDVYDTNNVQEFQINYQSETRYGEGIEIRMRKSDDTAGFRFFEGVSKDTGHTAFRAKMNFSEF